ERPELAEQISAFVGHLGRAEPINRIWPRFFANLEHLIADLVDRSFPGDSRPLPIHELHRIAQTPFAVHQLAYGSTLRAMRSAIDGGIPARLLADPDPVQHLCSHGASDST